LLRKDQHKEAWEIRDSA